MRHQTWFGFPADRNYKFRINGRNHKIGASGIRTLTLLSNLHRACIRSRNLYWPFQYRQQLRQLPSSRGSRAVLSLVIERTNDPNLRRLAIWLRGHCAGHVGTKNVARFGGDPNEKIRKEVARTLKRLEAWDSLRVMSSQESNERIQRIATVVPPQPFEARLAKFSQIAIRLDVQHAEHGLYLSPNFVAGQGRPPKPNSLIRTILNRIHRLVSEHSR